MPKQGPPLALMLPDREPGAPAIQWIYKVLRDAILNGRLAAGTRMPATRELARQYGLSRGTVVAGFEQLKAEGYLNSRIGSGTYVAESPPDQLLHVEHPARGKELRAPSSRRLSNYGERVREFGGLRGGPIRAFRANQPALDLFPTTLWARVTARRLRQATMDLLRGSGPLGYPPLQQAVSEYLNTSRGVHCTPEQIIILSGVQEALDLVARLFLNPGDRVAVEHPGYLGATLVFDAHGLRPVPVRVDAEGMQVSGSLKGARLVYLTPAHQFPLGVTMSLHRRLALLEWARRSGAIILEDDYDSEYRYRGRPVPALQGLDRGGQVLFAGSFSKVLFPSLRLGYLVVPADLIDRFAAAQSIINRHAPLLQQAVLADFMVEGHFGRHIRRMRAVYAERLGVLLEAVKERLAGMLAVSEVEAGLQTAGFLPEGVSDVAVARAVAEREVEVLPLSRYALARPAVNGLQLGFAAVDPVEIRRGVAELAGVLEHFG